MDSDESIVWFRQHFSHKLTISPAFLYWHLSEFATECRQCFYPDLFAQTGGKISRNPGPGQPISYYRNNRKFYRGH